MAIAAATVEMSNREKKRKEEEEERRHYQDQVRKQRVRDHLDSRERHAITHALRLAAKQFEKDSADMARAGQVRLVEQFDRQVKDSRDVLEWLEE